MNLDELVKELRTYIEIVNSGSIGRLNGDEVSRLAVKLAGYNSTLGEYVADVERAADFAEASYELKKENAFKEARAVVRINIKGKEEETTVADADNIKRLAAMDEKGAWLEAKYQYRVLAILRSDVKELIGTLRGRLSYLKSEKEHASIS